MSTQALKTLKAKRATIKAQCTRTRNAIEAIDPRTIDITYVKQRKEKFAEYWKQFNDVQTQIDELMAIATDLHNVEQLEQEQEIEYTNFEEIYFYIAGKIEKLLATACEPARESEREGRRNGESAALSNDQGRDIGQIHLPKIAIPKFSGHCEEWYPFYNTFESMIHANAKLTNIQRFHYLISSLDGDAAHVIKSLEITPDNYNEALDLLKQRYDDKRVISQQHIRALYDLPTITKGNYIALRKLVDDVLRHLRSLKSLGRPIEYWDDLVVHLIITKLDSSIISEWEDHIPGGDMPTVKQLTDFLAHKCKTMSVIAKKTPNDLTTLNQRKSKTSNVHLAASNILCLICKGKHQIFQCPSFLKMSIEDRNKEVRIKRLCMNCLRSTNHLAKDCRASTCQTCSKKHNTLLHVPDKGQGNMEHTNPPVQSNNSHAATLSHHAIQSKHYQVILSTAMVNAFDQYGNPHACRLLLDSGSQSNFITERLAKKLNLPHKQANLSIIGIGSSRAHSNRIVNVRIGSTQTSFSQEVECYVLHTITGKLPRVYIDIKDIQIPNNIRLADNQFHIPNEIDMLLGAELFLQLLCVGQIQRHKYQPILQKTQLGWIVGGGVSNNHSAATRICGISANQEVNQTLLKFWDLEHIVNETPFNPEERACIEYFTATTKKENARFTVQMPIKEEKLRQLGESRSIALRRFQSIERKLQGQPALRKQYIQFMQEYEDLNHMVRISDEQLSQHTSCYYIPHHAVLKNNSLTTKLRVVFDASCKSSTGVSLNDCLMVGPTLQQDLFSILLRFRTFRYAITADIAQMYRQIRVNKIQTPLQRIFWRRDPSEKIAVFELQTVTYGTACASFLAIRTMQELANIKASSHPIGSATILNDFYVDDLLSGANTEEEIKKIRDETIEVLKEGGFRLRKWASNHPEILKDMTQIDSQDAIHFINKDEEVGTLGMRWNVISDEFQYDINTSNTQRVTKRGMLSALAKIFDPLGILGPVTLTAKLLMQRVWQLNLAWDETVTMNVHTAWTQYEAQLNTIRNFKIPRYVACEEEVNTQVHGFADASEKAYGACVYFRTTDSHGQVHTRLLCSKSRVAPLKTITLPRLELCGALLLAQLVDKALKALRLKPESIHYWTDSTIVLHWIKATDRTWNTFVSNRVNEIHRLSQPNSWHHVPTEHNPADDVSRGLSPSSLIDSKLWWSGPAWLREAPQYWNTSIPGTPPEDLPEQKRTIKAMAVIEGQDRQDLFKKFSSITQLIRINALCLRFIHNIKGKAEDKITGYITTQELIKSNLRLVKIVQGTAFKEELQSLRLKGCVSPKSKLLSLSPFIDDQGVVRVGGRLRNAMIASDARHPILLPANHPFTELIIAHAHQSQLHAGTQATLAAIRIKYWPISARRSVKKYIKGCITCFKAAPVASEAKMSELPVYRVSLTKPFTCSGVDYGGPLHIKSGQLRNAKIVKAYIAIFICLATKAVHIELVSNLSTEAFLNALKRFIARRGKVSQLYSDNGTNFQGAANELKELQQMLRSKNHQDQVDRTLKENYIEWHFIPPHAPHFGGIWEAAIKTAKKHLKRIMGSAALTFEEMYTVLTQIEAVMNSRPLTPLSDDPNDLSYLTPGHFLVGDALTSVPQQDVTHVPVNRLSRWQYINQVYQHFWRRWSREYLQQLQQRTKWRYSKGLQPRKGDLVMMSENESSPSKWLVGRVIDTHPGTDGIVRVVSIRTSKGTYKRPITKICVLPLQGNSQDPSS